MASSSARHAIESIVQFADERAKEAAFENCWKKVEESAASELDLEALEICIHLLPPAATTERAAKSYTTLRRFVFDHVTSDLGVAAHLFLLAQACLLNATLGCMIFDDITEALSKAIDTDRIRDSLVPGIEHSRDGVSERIEAYFKFLKCSYWLPADQHHYITPALVSLIVKSLGQDGLDSLAHDTLSSLLSLLSNSEVVVLGAERLPKTWTNTQPTSKKRILRSGVLQDTFFDRLQDLSLEYFSVNASRAFRSWFQWISYICDNAVQTDIIYSPVYWSALRSGLINGFSDQRKYCLGIIQQTLVLCQKNFEASGMAFSIEKKDATIRQYNKFCTMYEIIVLDRYPNQVQACLPELTNLLGSDSLISATWTTALLSAGLNTGVQEGVRKLIGNWYLTYASSLPEACVTHISFLVEGLLPWATQGNLFTGSLFSSRTTTTCSHGAALSHAMGRILAAASATEPAMDVKLEIEGARISEKKACFRGILGYILETGGRIFAPSVLFLLEGLLHGTRQGGLSLDTVEVDMVVRVPRLPALPEIAADLCRVYCTALCEFRNSQDQSLPFQVSTAPGDSALTNDVNSSQSQQSLDNSQSAPGGTATLKTFLGEINSTQHKIIQKASFVPACKHVTAILETDPPASFLPDELLQILDAFWEEADRQDYPRPVALQVAPLFFHPTCIQVCMKQTQISTEDTFDLKSMLTKVLISLHKFAEGRTYLVSGLAKSLRQACFLHPEALSLLPIDDFLVRFIENPPLPKKEFLFEVVAATKLNEHRSNTKTDDNIFQRGYEDYYGQREWVGYAAIIDLLNRFPKEHLSIAKNITSRLLEPWRLQKAPIPIISKWKNVLQLQVMLMLTESCVDESDADWYLDSFMHALVLEPWPRYRYLLEWIITRIYFRFPSKAHRILDDLGKLDENSPVHVASLMKLALLAAPFLDSEEFTLRLMMQLIPFSASPKVHIRHESHWCFPTLFDLAVERNWDLITTNPAFIALDKHVRALDKFNAPPSTIRTLKLDAVQDFTITKIFQGQYLRIETPDLEFVAHEDFVQLQRANKGLLSRSHASPPRVPLGEPLTDEEFTAPASVWKKPTTAPEQAPEGPSSFFQTKSGFDFASLLPSAGPPSAQQKRPASVILVASLIDNPTNLGGLSRISESFGLEALYIDELKKTAHKDFRATSVTSEKHFPIHELKVHAVPQYLLSMKTQGYEVVGIEQTDRSGILGDAEGGKGLGLLPQKCVLVLGSERGGISSEVLAVLDRCVEIRTVGVTRSLNVQTAGGIAVYEWWREWVGQA